MRAIIMEIIKKNKQRGDTIVEVLIAMAVLGMVLGVAFGISNRSYVTGLNAQERTEALEIAESQIELLRIASSSKDDSLLDMPTPRLFCINPNGANLARVEFGIGVTVQPTQGVTDPIVYPSACGLGTDNRYKVSVEQTALLRADGTPTDGKIFSVRVRWQSISGNIINEVNQEYRTYKFEGVFSLDE